ncbi:LPXTG cell wall anchor domain-containing protein [Streptomyces sp. G45]|uniref:LPXTG cell wall anchor domain-containing protein n=1 Tax=Streptomyces sp. G45 TaxID=3406627 RepID=UPI003C15812B
MVPIAHRHRRALVAAVAVLVAALSALALVPYDSAARADPRMSVRLDPGTSPVPSGDHVTYNGFIQCSIPGDCQDVTVTFTPPPGASGKGVVSQPYPPGVTGVTANDDGTVTVTYSSIASGQSSQLTVSWPTEDYWTPPGDQRATMTATAANGDGTPSTDDAAVQVTAEPNPAISKEGPSTARPGETITYKVTATNDPRNTNRPRGNLALENTVLTDVLPEGVDLVDATPAGYTYDAATRTLTWPVDTEPDRPGDQLAQVKTYPYGVVHEIRVKVPDDATDGTTLTNTATISGDPHGPSTEKITESDTADTVIGTGSGEVSGTLDKSVDTPLAADGQRVSYVLRFANTGTDPADARVTDALPDGFDGETLSLSTPTGGAYTGPWTVTVTRRDGTTETVTPDSQTIALSDYGDVVAVRVDVPDLAARTNLIVQIAGKADGSELPGGSGDIDNCAQLDLTGASGTANEESCTSFHIEPEVSQPDLSKSTDPTPVGPGGSHTWTVTLRNDRYRTGSSPLRPRFVDLVPRQLSYVTGSWTLADDQPDYCPAADRYTETVSEGPDGRTRVELTAEPGAEIPADDSACVYTFRTLVEPGVASGTYGGSPADADYAGNRAGLYDAERPVNTRTTDRHDIDGDGDTSENVAEATDDFAIAESSALFVTKEVKGDQDDAFQGSAEVPGQEDEVGQSTVSGTVEYRTVLGNMGNTTLTNVVAYDLLPAPGTPGVTSGRYDDDVTSQWRPTLTGPIDAGGAPVTITYSEKDDPCRPEMDNTPDNTAPFQCDGDPDPTFVPADQVTDWSRIRSVRFDFGDHVFAAGERYTLRWLMDVPDEASGDQPFEGGERTWNKIAIAGDRRQPDGTTRPLLATEAPWVVDEVNLPPSPSPSPSPSESPSPSPSPSESPSPSPSPSESPSPSPSPSESPSPSPSPSPSESPSPSPSPSESPSPSPSPSESPSPSPSPSESPSPSPSPSESPSPSPSPSESPSPSPSESPSPSPSPSESPSPSPSPSESPSPSPSPSESPSPSPSPSEPTEPPSPSPSEPSEPPSPSDPSPSDSPSLPDTGSSGTWLASGIAATLLAAGALFAAISRRRREADAWDTYDHR